jgi:hypothetical protein
MAEDQVDALIAEFLQEAAAGKEPDREELLAQHPELADELRSFFADHDRFDEARKGVDDCFGLASEVPLVAVRESPRGEKAAAGELGGGLGFATKLDFSDVSPYRIDVSPYFSRLGPSFVAKPAPTKDGPRVAVEGVETEGSRRIVLFSTEALSVHDANARLIEVGLRGVMRLDEVRQIEKIPVLGTGKTDYKALLALIEK